MHAIVVLCLSRVSAQHVPRPHDYSHQAVHYYSVLSSKRRAYWILEESFKIYFSY
uniref:Uncharacterized protein n=1 Tax=Arundo donax TaxID=35708 RepID=A0A0A9AUU3_ARUDO